MPEQGALLPEKAKFLDLPGESQTAVCLLLTCQLSCTTGRLNCMILCWLPCDTGLGKSVPLYTHSFLGYGANVAFVRAAGIVQLREDKKDPCLPQGYALLQNQVAIVTAI
jgi:hypothetical protein